MAGPSIVAGAAYLPGHSLTARRGVLLACAADEDAVTLAVDAAERALAAWAGDRETIDALFVAVHYGPEVEGPQSQLIREALGLGASTAVTTFVADDLAGVAAIQGALAACASGAAQRALVLGADIGEPALRRGAGAAALLVEPKGDAGLRVRELGRRCALTHERWRASPEGLREPDLRFLEHRYAELAEGVLAGAEPAGPVVLTGGSANARRQLRAAGLGGAPDGARAEALDLGIAAPLFAVVEAGAGEGAPVTLLAHGSGQSVLLELERAPGGRFELPAALEPGPPPSPPTAVGPRLSLPAESPFFARTWGESLRGEAARCASCGHVAFPPSQRRICPKCTGREWERYPLPRQGTVLSAVRNRFLPDGFPSELVFVLGELQDGYHYGAPAPAEVGIEQLAIGTPVQLRLRRFTVRDGVPVYSLKFVPRR
ncbi:MAG TPA: hypothetical protein VHX88_21255 [Solirubrobacteraceae bacterium]|jgi:uncharacterized OB-fold protein|nr:hypothetical protein [Solirubrobacteraceae bacterium]